jgi:electron transfer flavoprotein beta subunit
LLHHLNSLSNELQNALKRTFIHESSGKLSKQRSKAMKVVVCIKQVPETEARVVAQDGQVSWDEASLVINPFDEYAVEASLQQKEVHQGSVIALCIGPESARDALEHALAMGVDEAILISDPALVNLDSQGAAYVLAAAVKEIGDVEMVILGRQTIDIGTGLTTAQTARVLGWPMLALAGSIKVDGGKVSVERVIEEGRQNVSANLPVVISVVQSIGEPRYPSFMGIRKASKFEIPVWSLAKLGIAAPAAIVTRIELMNPPARDQTCEILQGATLNEIAETLVDKILAEKVL